MSDDTSSDVEMNELLQLTVDEGASDLHLAVGVAAACCAFTAGCSLWMRRR